MAARGPGPYRVAAMMPRLPILLPLVALVAAAATLETRIRPSRPSAARPAGDPDSAETCGQCHTEIYQEWKGRAHHQAWDKELYQAALKEKTRPQVCHACHIPGPVLARLGRKPGTRDNLHSEGVTCIACHKSDDKIHGPYGSTTDAHPTEKNAAFTEAGATNLCYGCHALKIGPVLPLAKDHRDADFATKTGKHCTTCHMPEVERHMAVSMVTGKPVGEQRKGRRHTVLGPHDKEFCAKAFALAARTEDKAAVLAIENKAGHRLPGLTLREFVVTVQQTGADGAGLAEHTITIDSENGLKILETREFRFDLADGAKALSVSIDHRLDGKKVDTVLSTKLPL